MTDENTDNYSALYRQLKVCQLQSQKFARNVRNTKALNQTACLNSSKIKYLVQMGTFRDDLLRYQKLSADLYKFDQQDCIDIKQVMIESVEFRHLVKKLNKSIYITVSARGTAKNILAKYAPEKMAFMHGTKSQYPKIRQHYLMLYDQLLQLYQRNDFSFEKAKQMTDIASRLKMLCIEFNGNHPVFVRKMQHKVNVLNRYGKLVQSINQADSFLKQHKNAHFAYEKEFKDELKNAHTLRKKCRSFQIKSSNHKRMNRQANRLNQLLDKIQNS